MDQAQLEIHLEKDKDKKEICKRQRAFRNLDHQTTSDCESLKKFYPDEAFLVYLEVTANLYQCQQ